MSQVGTLYLLHFDKPLSQASHYLGFIVWTGPGSRDDERKLKNRKNHRQLCPICKVEFNAKKAAAKKARYLKRKPPV